MEVGASFLPFLFSIPVLVLCDIHAGMTRTHAAGACAAALVEGDEVWFPSRYLSADETKIRMSVCSN